MAEIARTRLLGVALKGFVASLAVFSAACAGQAATCESLATLALPDTTTVLAKLEPAGVELHLPGPPLGNLRAFCRVGGETKPTKDSNIKLRYGCRLHAGTTSSWVSGTEVGQEKSGITDMSDALQRGYATASTDTGHEGSAGDASFALGHPEKVIDFGYRAFPETTVKAKAILSAYYGDAARQRASARAE